MIMVKTLNVDHIGYLMAGMTIFCTVSSLEKVDTMLKTGDRSYIDIYLSASGFTNANIWATYAYMIGAIPLMVSQIVGILINGFLILFYFWLGPSAKVKDK